MDNNISVETRINTLLAIRCPCDNSTYAYIVGYLLALRDSDILTDEEFHKHRIRAKHKIFKQEMEN